MGGWVGGWREASCLVGLDGWVGGWVGGCFFLLEVDVLPFLQHIIQEAKRVRGAREEVVVLVLCVEVGGWVGG